MINHPATKARLKPILQLSLENEIIKRWNGSNEVKRELGEVGEMDEPGFAEDSPYRQEHTIATSVEMAICAIAGLSWSEYDKTVMSL